MAGIVVTPHVGRGFRGRPERLTADIAAATAELQRELKTRQVAIELLAGAEVMLDSSRIAARLGTELELTVGGKGRYALVEFPAGKWPRYATRMLHEIQLQGITPIIAHPERLQDIQQDIDVVANAVNQGVLLQVTARSVVGGDRRSKQSCHRLLQAGLVSFVASDAHSSEAIFPSEVWSALSKLVGEDITRQILVDNPKLVIAGKPVPMGDPARFAAARKAARPQWRRFLPLQRS